MKHELNGIFDKLEASLLEIRRELADRPRAVLVISGHWEEVEFTVSSGAAPGMVYDYFGFPEYTYHVEYRAPGSPELAARIQGLLKVGGLACRSDEARGYDHGTFSLMKPLYPEENIPVVQLSMKAGYAPALHIRAGELLAPLRDEGVLIIGSGSSFHDLRARGASALKPSGEFDRWLQKTLVDSPPSERLQRIQTWTRAPSARAAHPREDHLLPLMVVVGAAEEERGACVYHEDAFMGSWSLSSFRLGELPAPSSHEKELPEPQFLPR
jgi:aromatic ring-opening dioxygenase catalytic subunit (LigB family)